MKARLLFPILVAAILIPWKTLLGGTVRLQYGNQQVIDCEFSGWPYCYGSEEVGNITYLVTGITWERYYCKIPLTAFPDTSTIVSRAVLKVYLLDDPSYDNNVSMTVDRLAEPMLDSYRTSVGGITAPSYFNSPSYDSVTVDGYYSGWVEFDVTDLVRGWITQEFPNDGFLIRNADLFSGEAGTLICESLYPDATKRPVLEITGPALSDTLITGSEPLPTDGPWIRTNSRGNAFAIAFASTGSALYAGLYGDGYGTIDSSSDAGNTWISSAFHMASFPVLSLAVDNSIILAGTLDQGLWRSTDGGLSWNEVQGVPAADVSWSALQYAQNRFFAAFPGGVFVSADEGATWKLVLSDSTNLQNPNGFTFDGTNVYVSTARRGVYRSTDQGVSWISANAGLTDTNLTCIGSNGAFVFAGASAGKVFLSSDHGMNWSEGSNNLPSAARVTALYSSGTLLFGGTSDGGLYLTRNYGKDWILDTASLGGGPINAFGSDGTYLFAGIWGGTGGVWRCPLDQLTSVEHERTQQIPTVSILEQNYPNPFNPRTTIRFFLTTHTIVSLRIYDVLGREITTLFRGPLGPGQHSFVWDGSSSGSGMYLCRLDAGFYSQTRKIVLLK